MAGSNLLRAYWTWTQHHVRVCTIIIAWPCLLLSTISRKLRDFKPSKKKDSREAPWYWSWNFGTTQWQWFCTKKLHSTLRKIWFFINFLSRFPRIQNKMDLLFTYVHAQENPPTVRRHIRHSFLNTKAESFAFFFGAESERGGKLLYVCRAVT